MNHAKAKPSSRRNPPSASFKKRFIYTFYLIQPMLQFFALVAIIGVLSRCSPLSPSTDKSIGLLNRSGNPQQENSDNAQNIAHEELIEQNMKEVNEVAVESTSNTSFDKNNRNALVHENEAVEEGALKSNLKFRFASSSHGEIKKLKKFLTLRLSQEQTELLVNDGTVRLDLGQVTNLNEDEKKALYNAMHEAIQSDGVTKLDASSYMIFNDPIAQDAHKDLNKSMRLKISISIPVENQAYLRIRIAGPSPDFRADGVAAFDEALHDAGKLAIVLE